MKFYLVVKPSLRGSSDPEYYYTFADDEIEAIHKTDMKWGYMCPNVFAKEIIGEALNKIVIATKFYG